MNEKIDLRVKKTYMALIKSFKELLETKDIYDITVNEICDNAMVGRGTFYNHFSGKYDFILFLIKEIINDCINKALYKTVSDNLCEYYKSFFNSFTEDFEKNAYNFKSVDDNTAIGIALSSFDIAYDKLLKSLQNFHTENNKSNCLIAKHLTTALILIIFNVMKNDTLSFDDTKECTAVLLEKLLGKC